MSLSVRLPVWLCSDWQKGLAYRPRPERRRLHALAAEKGAKFSGSPAIAAWESLQRQQWWALRRGGDCWLGAAALASSAPRNPNASKTPGARRAHVWRVRNLLRQGGYIFEQGGKLQPVSPEGLLYESVRGVRPDKMPNSASKPGGDSEARVKKKSRVWLDRPRSIIRGNPHAARDVRGRFCRPSDPTQPTLLRLSGNEPSANGKQAPRSTVAVASTPPADGVRGPAANAAEYGVAGSRLEKSSSNANSGGTKMAEEGNGPRAGETWQQYFLRVAREQEAKVKTPEGRARLAEHEAWRRQQRRHAQATAAAEARRNAAQRERARAEASQRLEERMLAAGRVRMFIDPGKPWGSSWLAAAAERVQGLTERTVPKHLGVGALDYGLDELGRLLSQGAKIENPAGFVVDLAKRVMRRERWRWAIEQDALNQPHLVVPLTPEGQPMSASPVRLVASETPRNAAPRRPQAAFSR